jgi:LytS/YehU family sensor histidine kinase
MIIGQQNIRLNEDQNTDRYYDLELFKMLLQPHFLFNSLNNLYALSVKQSDRTSDAIAGLSELLEKVVYYSQLEKISLSKEVELIKDYINLEKIWLGETSFKLDFQISGDLDSVEVPPLVLYTFIENCFKHGIRKCSGDAWVTINIQVKKNNLFFNTRNLVSEWDDEQAASDYEGLGVNAAKEVLEHKCNGHYILKTGTSKKIHSVDLMIKPEKKVA